MVHQLGKTARPIGYDLGVGKSLRHGMIASRVVIDDPLFATAFDHTVDNGVISSRDTSSTKECLDHFASSMMGRGWNSGGAEVRPRNSAC